MSKPKILIFCAFYLPGFRGGGPIRTIANLVDALGDEFDFFVVAMDRDLGDSSAYRLILRNSWNIQGKANVFYVGPGIQGLLKIWSILWKNSCDVIYLNSFFSFRFSIFPLLLIKLIYKLRFVRNCRLILGPRGEFSQGALTLKARKKRFYLKLVNFLGFYSKVIWHASTQHELRDIENAVGKNSLIKTAIDLSVDYGNDVSNAAYESKRGDGLRIIFISRISSKKNLLGALSILRGVRKNISFHVYGPVEDKDYWSECLVQASVLPGNVDFSYRGLLEPQRVMTTIADYDLLFFPTFGENYGHVIAEAIMVGVPVLISDQTPWRDLSSKNLGWDISLSQSDEFVKKIEMCCEIQPLAYSDWKQGVARWAKKNIAGTEAIAENRKLLRE